MMDFEMGKLIAPPIEKEPWPVPTCEVCNEDYEVSQETEDFLCLTHSCKWVPHDERVIHKSSQETRYA